MLPINTRSAESRKEIGALRPVNAIATPISDIIPAPITCPIPIPIKSFNVNTRFNSLVEVPIFFSSFYSCLQ